mgnify:CR=1 FL=1
MLCLRRGNKHLLLTRLMTSHTYIPDMFEPREKGVSEWQTFNAVRRESGAYTVASFRAPVSSPTTPRIVRYGNSQLLILKKA